LVRKHLGAQVVDSAGVVRLLEYRAISAGTAVFLDAQTMLPIEPLCSWFRHLAFDDKDAKTLREMPISCGGSSISFSRGAPGCSVRANRTCGRTGLCAPSAGQAGR
jgi:hypothetical protein